jgi:hypothetical protein
MIHTPSTRGGEKEDYPPLILLPPPLLVGSNKCDDTSEAACLDMEHFHWTACQQQTQVNVACSRAQWMKDSLAALLVNHDNRRTDEAPASCSRAAAQQPMLLLSRLLKRVQLQLRLGCRRIANDLYIRFCRALPLEYLRLWVYLWHLSHSDFPCATAHNNKNNNAASISNHFAKETLKRDLIFSSLFILVVVVQVRIQLSFHQPQHDDISTATRCLLRFQPDDAISLQPSVATTLPFHTLFFETVHYGGLSSSEQIDWLLL